MNITPVSDRTLVTFCKQFCKAIHTPEFEVMEEMLRRMLQDRGIVRDLKLLDEIKRLP